MLVSYCLRQWPASKKHYLKKKAYLLGYCIFHPQLVLSKSGKILWYELEEWGQS